VSLYRGMIKVTSLSVESSSSSSQGGWDMTPPWCSVERRWGGDRR
jgi:hypothetical protein